MRSWDSFLARGRKDEDFVSWLITTTKGGSVAVATRDEDINSHIDLWWTTKEGRRLSIDVKGPKKVRRGDIGLSDEETWIEFTAVDGRRGWLYGDAMYIAFVRQRHTLFVRRAALAAFADKQVVGKYVTHHHPGKMYWVRYNRPNRQDVICLAPYAQLEPLAEFVIKYPSLMPINMPS